VSFAAKIYFVLFFNFLVSSVLKGSAGRILKHLAAMEFIVELDADNYCHTRLSESMVKPIYRDGITMW
jgi:hypothetical protein